MLLAPRFSNVSAYLAFPAERWKEMVKTTIDWFTNGGVKTGLFVVENIIFGFNSLKGYVIRSRTVISEVDSLSADEENVTGKVYKKSDWSRFLTSVRNGSFLFYSNSGGRYEQSNSSCKSERRCLERQPPL
jgi:hypothetical protein